MIDFLRAFLVTALPILALILGVEFISRRQRHTAEYIRKFIHIAVGTYAAFWPWFISWRNIELLALGALGALVVSRIFHVFRSIYAARQFGTGEFLSAVSIGVVALITHEQWLFAASILHLSLADGLAAVVGTEFGAKNGYKILGQRRSVVGTFTFVVVSAVIVSAYFSLNGVVGLWPTLLWLPFVTAAVENIGVWGTDNFLVPVFVCLVLGYAM